MIKINYSYTILFASTVAGVGTAADSTPTAVLWRNGSASGVSVTVSTTAQTGLYKAVFTTDAGWAAADFLELYVTATIAGTAGYLAKVWSSTEIGAVVLDATRQQALADLAAMITGSGTADAKFDAVALSLAPGGGALTGPFTRTITVTDAADDAPIEAAKVRLYRTGETETKATDADGEASFTTEAATFSYAVTAEGYGGASGTIVISANGATTIELTATAVTPPTDPALSAIEVLCLNANFAATAGIDIDFRMSAVASGDQNRAHPGAKKTVTSNVSGIARFEGPQGATIEWKRGTGQQWTAVTLDNDSVTNVTSLIGSP
jgi:hypothetical protein